MTPIRHELIRASAGTGKTYQLVNRYLRLLFATGEPEKIVALTFTRKAAGEFFEKIFRRLADCAADDQAAKALGQELGQVVTTSECRRFLRLLLERLHRLQLSTYDSFFTRIVQSFPFELGLSGVPTLLDEDQRMQAIQRAQQALSQRTASDPQFLADFWHACKRASMGVEMKSVTEIVTRFIEDNHTLFFDAHHPERWGCEARIWGGRCPWECPEADLVKEARVLRESLDWTSLSPDPTQFWQEFLLELEAWRPPLEVPKRILYFLDKLLPYYDQLDSGFTEVLVGRRKQILTSAQGVCLKRIVQFVCWSVMKPKLEATQGLYDLVRMFEEIYRREVRLLGQLTLEDATRLLAGGPSHGEGLKDQRIRELLGYRLDGAFDHWLLDEFQDTSRIQWRAIYELVDEALQDSEQRRTFFAVGDTKQSLYGWRGSDDRLFDRVENRYRAVLNVRSLNQSYRSTPDVLAMANAVLGRSDVIAELFTPELAQRWSAMWQEHQAADGLQGTAGHACLLHAPEEDTDRFATILNLLNTLRPIEKDLSVAVLTQQNATADALVEYLRAHGGPPCSLAANVRPGLDNVIAAGLRSFLTVAAHPDDSLAWQHLRMTAMGSTIDRMFGTPERLSAQLLSRWSTHGLVGLVDAWIELCRSKIDTDDSFSLGRLEIFRTAALTLEERGELDIDAFVRHLTSLSIREHDTPGQVAVMTVHKAKGLDWDIVILSDLHGKTLLERRGGLEVHRDAEGEIQWILDMPTSSIAQFDASLDVRLNASKQDAAFENLCVLYVGLTRAKRGLYVVTHAAKGTSKNFHRLLDEALGAAPHPIELAGQTFTCAWESGTRDWFEAVGTALRLDGGEGRLEPLPLTARVSLPVPKPLQPSSERAARVLASALFEPPSRQRDLGTAVHKAVCKVEWLTADPLENTRRIAQWTDGLEREVAALVRGLLQSPEAGQAFLKPTGTVSLWREKAFELLLGDRWISGRFDRVVITRDGDGKPTEVAVIDVKVHGAPVKEKDLRKQHASQMETYRHAAARLLGVPDVRVSLLVLAIETTAPEHPQLVVM